VERPIGGDDRLYVVRSVVGADGRILEDERRSAASQPFGRGRQWKEYSSDNYANREAIARMEEGAECLMIR